MDYSTLLLPWAYGMVPAQVHIIIIHLVSDAMTSISNNFCCIAAVTDPTVVNRISTSQVPYGLCIVYKYWNKYSQEWSCSKIGGLIVGIVHKSDLFSSVLICGWKTIYATLLSNWRKMPMFYYIPFYVYSIFISLWTVWHFYMLCINII